MSRLRFLFSHQPPQRQSIFQSRIALTTSASTSEYTQKMPIRPSSTDTPDLQTSTQHFLKIDVRSKGCSGSAYALFWTPDKNKFDEVVEVDKGNVHSPTTMTHTAVERAKPYRLICIDHLLLIDSRALFTLIGSQMDYVEEKLSAGFIFNNPNVKETCGCGQSFVV